MASSGRGSRASDVRFRLPAPQPGCRSWSSGRARVMTNSGWLRDHSSRYPMKSRSALSAHWRSSNTMTTGFSPASRSKNSRHALNSSSGSREARSSKPRRCATRGSTHWRSSGSGMCCSVASRNFSIAEAGSSPSAMPARDRTISASAQ